MNSPDWFKDWAGPREDENPESEGLASEPRAPSRSPSQRRQSIQDPAVRIPLDIFQDPDLLAAQEFFNVPVPPSPPRSPPRLNLVLPIPAIMQPHLRGIVSIPCEELKTVKKNQITTIERLVSRCPQQHGLIYFHSMGSGKTRLALYTALSLDANLYQRILIVVPTGLQTPWIDEFQKTDTAEADKERFRFIEYQSLFQILQGEKIAKEAAKNRKENPEPSIFQDIDAVIADEAHYLLAYTNKSNSIAEFFKRKKKVILLTGTPIQQNWSDYAILINLASGERLIPGVLQQFYATYENKPSRLLLPGKFILTLKALSSYLQSTFLLYNKIVGSGSELINAPPKGDDPNGYIAWAWVTAGKVFQRVTAPVFAILFPDIITTMASSLSMILRQYVPVDKVTVFLGYLFQSKEYTEKFCDVLSSVSLYSTVAITVLKLMGVFTRSVDVGRVFEDTREYVSFFDYSLKIKDGSIPKDKTLAYPLQTVKMIEMPYTTLQIDLLVKNCISNGFETEEELIISGRVADQDDAWALNKFTYESAQQFRNMMTCMGNISLSNYLCTTKRMETANMYGSKHYIAVPRDNFTAVADTLESFFVNPEPHVPAIRTNEEVRRDIQEGKFADASANFVRQTDANLILRGRPLPIEVRARYVACGKNIFTCPKYEAALDILLQQRKTRHFLPVVYSNFDSNGIQTFSAFLHSQGHTLLFISADDPPELRTSLLRYANEPYRRFIDNEAAIPIRLNDIYRDNASVLDQLAELKDPFLKSSQKPSGQENAREVYKHATLLEFGFQLYKNTGESYESYVIRKLTEKTPLCVLLDNRIREGYSFTMAPSILVLEPVPGIGNQEQVYGRVLRTMSYESSNTIPETVAFTFDEYCDSRGYNITDVFLRLPKLPITRANKEIYQFAINNNAELKFKIPKCIQDAFVDAGLPIISTLRFFQVRKGYLGQERRWYINIPSPSAIATAAVSLLPALQPQPIDIDTSDINSRIYLETLSNTVNWFYEVAFMRYFGNDRWRALFGAYGKVISDQTVGEYQKEMATLRDDPMDEVSVDQKILEQNQIQSQDVDALKRQLMKNNDFTVPCQGPETLPGLRCTVYKCRTDPGTCRQKPPEGDDFVQEDLLELIAGND